MSDDKAGGKQLDRESLLSGLRVIDLEESTRVEAIRALIAAGHWSDSGILPEDVFRAIEEREATAQTIAAEDLAIPHASIDWNGDYRIVIGRRREGVEYGVAGQSVKLIVLLVTGRLEASRHLELLALLAELLRSRGFRQRLVDAPACSDAERLLRERTTPAVETSPVGRQPAAQLSIELVRHAVELAAALDVQAVLLAVDQLASVPWAPLELWTGRLLIVTSERSDDVDPDRPDTHVLDVPHSGLSRMDRTNLGMLLAASNGLLAEESDVVCVTGPTGQRLDCIAVIRPAHKFHAVFRDNVERGTARIPPAVILRVLSLAVELAAEGREGRPVGTMFILGDTRRVLRRARQLVLNPFHGFTGRLRNILDPGLAETIKEFASLDGAFIVKPDGTMLSAGTYLIPESGSDSLPGGLGARHQAAVSITARTRALAVTVSQSTGTVSVFQDGGDVLTLERASLTRW